MTRLALTALSALLLPAAAFAQASGQQYTQPIPNQNQSQIETNQSQQPPNAR